MAPDSLADDSRGQRWEWVGRAWSQEWGGRFGTMVSQSLFESLISFLIRRFQGKNTVKYRSGQAAHADLVSVRIVDALQTRGCPLCHLLDEAVNLRMRTLFREMVNDPVQRERLRGSLGFCRRHNRYLMVAADALGLAILTHDLVIQATRRLDRRMQGFSVPELRPCPECEAETSDTATFSRALAVYLEDRSAQLLYQTGDGLCVIHLERVIAAASPGVRRFLTEAEQARLGTLAQELAAFIRKADYRYSGEGLGTEADAPRRAIAKLSGLDEPGRAP